VGERSGKIIFNCFSLCMGILFCCVFVLFWGNNEKTRERRSWGVVGKWELNFQFFLPMFSFCVLLQFFREMVTSREQAVDRQKYENHEEREV
jgi:hypothetical protein